MKKLRLVAIALVAIPLFTPPAQANPAAVQAAIAACEANPYACAVVGAAAGTWIMWKNAPKLFCTYAQCSTQKHMHDPESEGGTDSDYVWASSPEQAQRICERLAARRGNRLDSVRPASNWTNNAGMKRYVCYMTVFGR